MTELYPSDSDLNALSGTSDSGQGVLYVSTGESPYYTNFYKMLYRLLDVARRAGDLRVYKDGDLTFGVRAGMYLNADAAVSYAGAAAQALTDDATNYLYLTADGTLTKNTTGFPVPSVTPHIRLATIATGSASGAGVSGEYAYTDITDKRKPGFLSVSGNATANLNGLDWQESVADELDFTSAEPTGQSLGDRYVNTGTGTSNQTSQSVTANYVYEWNDTSWTEIVPTEGACCLVEDRDMLTAFNGTSWVDIGTFALLSEAQTFFAATDISGAEAETLTDGSNADAKHVHTLDSGVSDVTATAAQLNEAGTFFGATDISGAEAETLTDGSNADSLHVHSALDGYTHSLGGIITSAGAVTFSGAYSVSMTLTGATTITLPTSGTVATETYADGVVSSHESTYNHGGVNEANTFFAATDISGAEAETLSDGSNADALHVHSYEASGAVSTHESSYDHTDLPSGDQKDALAGTSGTPSSTNKYVTNDDSRNSDERTPSDGSVTAAKLATAVQDVIPNLNVTAGAEAADKRTITVQARDAADNNLAQRVLVRVWIAATEYAAPDATGNTVAVETGTTYETETANAAYKVISDANGTVAIGVTISGAASRYIMAEIDGRIYSSGQVDWAA